MEEAESLKKSDMDKGIRNILIVLGVLCLASLISAVKFFQIEKATYQQYLKAKSESVKLNEKASLLDQERLKLAKKLEAVSKEEEELKEKYNSLIDEKKELNIQVEMLTQEKEGLEKKISQMESDGFLARLLKKKVTLEVKVKNLEKKLKKTKNLEKEIEAITKERMELEEQLAQEKEVSEYLSKDFLKERQERLIATSRLERIEQEKEELKVVLDRARNERVSLEKELVRLKEKLKDSKEEQEKLTAQIADMEGALKERLAQVNLVRSKLKKAIKKSKPKSEEAVELPPIVVRAETPSAFIESQPQKTTPRQITRVGGLEGRIMTINEEHHFVVIDLGSDDGLGAGMVFGVYRDNKEIARIRVVEAREQIAAADIISLESRIKIRAGDIINPVR